MPITDEVRESNSPWIKASVWLPNHHKGVCVKYHDNYYKGKRNYDSAHPQMYIELHSTTILTKDCEWLDEEKLSRILAELEAKDKRIAELEGLVEKVDKGWHIAFYRATSTMTASEIENFYNEKLPQFKQQHNL